MIAGVLLGASVLAACTSGRAPEPHATAGELDTYLALIMGIEDETAEAFEAQALRAEEVVAACMHEAGFEYVPDPTVHHSSVQDAEALAAFDAHAYAAEYGYGLLEPGERPDITMRAVADPNAAYQMAMSTAEAAAYEEALLGVFAFGGATPTDEDIDAAVAAPWSEKGCQGRGQHEAFDFAVATSDDVVSIREEWEGFWRGDLDPRFDSIRTAWATCMDEAGTPVYSRPQDAKDQLAAEMLVRQQAVIDGLPGSEDGWNDLRRLEISVAVADLACQEDVDYQDELGALEDERQREFVDERRAELDALVARYASGG